ncbi:MAG: hypothetical protein ACYS14_07380 [Planctomycetota bacterium]|jgi:hypothetical protein
MSERTINILAALVLLALSLSIMGNSMTKPLGRDEHMYCAAGVLMAQGKTIYRDFAYPTQLPYHPLLYAILFKALGTTHYLLVGRLVSVLADILVMLCIVALYRLAFGNLTVWGTSLGLCAAALYVYNPAVEYANGYAWNNDVVVLCVAVAFVLFARIEASRKVGRLHIAAIGALLTVATFMRSTTVVAGLLFLLALLSLPAQNIKERIKTTLPFLIVAGLVAIYPVYVIARAPGAFSVNLFKIHLLNSQWLHQIGIVHDKFRLALAYLTLPGYLMLLVVAVYLIGVLVLNRGRLRISNGRSALLAASLTGIFFAAALSLPTIWRQYLAPPVPFLLCSFAYPLASLKGLSSRKGAKIPIAVGAALIGVGALAAWATGIRTSEKMAACFRPARWIPIQLHRTATDIAENTREPKQILTLGPLFALEGGCGIYPELSAGPFTYRIGNLMSQTDRELTRTAGPDEIAHLTGQSPPSAIIVGTEPQYFSRLEEPLESLAGADWSKKTYENDLRVYFRP